MSVPANTLLPKSPSPAANDAKARKTPQRLGQFTSTNRPNRVNMLSDARDLEQVTLQQCLNPKLDPLVLASLVRSFVALVDCIQRLRGIPTPGQYRPELSPQKLIAALKKANARTPIELMASGTFHDEPGDDETANENPKVEPEEKESLLPKPEGDRQTGGGGTNEEGAVK